MNYKSIIIGCLLFLLLLGCNSRGSSSGFSRNVTEIEEPYKGKRVSAGDDIVLNYNIEHDSGLIEIMVLHSGGATLFSKKFEQEEEGSVTLPVETGGFFHVLIHRTEYSGKYDVDWEVFAGGRPPS